MPPQLRDVLASKHVRNFGREFPQTVCEAEKDEQGLSDCRVCVCPGKLMLQRVGNEFRCAFGRFSVKAAEEYILAPCSPSLKSMEGREVPGYLEMGKLNQYAVYRYHHEKLLICDEYLVWDSWGASEIKKYYDYQTAHAVVQVGNSVFRYVRSQQITYEI